MVKNLQLELKAETETKLILSFLFEYKFVWTKL